MTITPNWKKETPGNPPAGSHSAQPPNLSDLDETQPSMRRPAPEMPLQTRGQSSFTANAQQPPERASGNSNSQDDNLVGTMFADRYEILEMLGRGGMGSVYKARNRINKNFRAVKLMHAHLVADPQVFRRFQQEATAAARINHPNAISIIDMGMAADGPPYLIMDFLDGISLSQLLRYKKKLAITEALDIFKQMCGALAEAHSHGVIHRDIKPSNVMILDGPNGEYIVKVVDFGIAKVFPQEGDPTMKDTTTGELFGSPPYMSPEQCLGKRLDYRSDIYSMGCLMYEVLTGAPPLVGQNALGTMYRQINEMPTSLTDIKDDVRLIQRLDEIISKTLQKNPDQRYQNILELHKDLESAGELSSRKVAALSAVGLKWQAIERSLNNSLGSAKNIVFSVVIVGFCLCAGGVLIVSPYVLAKDPTAAERAIAWQPLTGISTGMSSGSVASFMLTIPGQDIWVKAHNARIHDKLDDAVRLNDQLFILYRPLVENYAAPDSNIEIVMNNLGQALLEWRLDKIELSSGTRRSEDSAITSAAQDRSTSPQSHVERAPVQEENLAAKTGSQTGLNGLTKREVALHALKLIKSEKMNCSGAEANLNAFVALELIQKPVEGDSPGRYIDAAVTHWVDHAPTTPESSALTAIAVSRFGDFYASQNQQEKAVTVYELAKKYWALLGDKGYGNQGVVEDRLGRIYMHLGNKLEAIQHFARSQQMFYSAAHTDTLDGAKALFDEADALSAIGHHLDALKVHTEAAKIWAQKRPHVGS